MGEVLDALASNEVDGALLDLYTASSSQPLLEEKQLTIKQIISDRSGYGMVLTGEMAQSEMEIRNYLKSNHLFLKTLINKYVGTTEVCG